jgi:hypothetical protein
MARHLMDRATRGQLTKEGNVTTVSTTTGEKSHEEVTGSQQQAHKET